MITKKRKQISRVIDKMCKQHDELRLMLDAMEDSTFDLINLLEEKEGLGD